MKTLIYKTLIINDSDLSANGFKDPKSFTSYNSKTTEAFFTHDIVIYSGKKGTHILKDRNGYVQTMYSNNIQNELAIEELQSKMLEIQNIINKIES